MRPQEARGREGRTYTAERAGVNEGRRLFPGRGRGDPGGTLGRFGPSSATARPARRKAAGMSHDDPTVSALALFGFVALASFAAGWLAQGLLGAF